MNLFRHADYVHYPQLVCISGGSVCVCVRVCVCVCVCMCKRYKRHYKFIILSYLSYLSFVRAQRIHDAHKIVAYILGQASLLLQHKYINNKCKFYFTFFSLLLAAA